jgi:outer membrane protein assembly factor BamB
MSNLFDALVAGKVTTKAGPKQIVLEAGVSDDLFAIDAEKGTILWSKHYSSDYTGPQPGQDPLCPGGQTAIPVMAPNGPGKYTIYSVSWDGMLHQINLADGEDIAPPVKFVPANGKTWSLNLYKGVIYTHTSQGCGGNPNHAYAFDLATKKVGNWDRPAAACGDVQAPQSARPRARCTPAPATAFGIRKRASTATASSA